MADSRPTHHQRVLAHLKSATGAMGEHRRKIEASLIAHVDAQSERERAQSEEIKTDVKSSEVT